MVYVPHSNEAIAVFPNAPPQLKKDSKKNELFSTRVYPIKAGESSQLANIFHHASSLRRLFA
jgi:hypothetical protein